MALIKGQPLVLAGDPHDAGRHSRDDVAARPHPGRSDPGQLREELDRWVAAGYLRETQAAQIFRAETNALAPPPGQHTLVTEALGYLGGLAVLVGAAIGVNQFWDRLSTTGAVLTAAGTTTLLLLAGVLVRSPLTASKRRLQGVLWLLSLAACGWLLVLVTDSLLHWTSPWAPAAVAAMASCYAAALWLVSEHALQHLGTFVSLSLTVGLAANALPARSGFAVGVAVVTLGASWALGGRYRTAPSGWALILGSGGALVGAVIAASWSAPAAGFSLAILAGAVVSAVRLRNLVLLGITAPAALVILPLATDRFFGGSSGGPISLVVAGLVLVLAALMIARRPEAGPSRAARAKPLPPLKRNAVVGAVLLAGFTAAAILGSTGAPVETTLAAIATASLARHRSGS